jgi:arylsulfatase A-like enzyme
MEVWRGGEIVENRFENRLLTEKFTAEAIRFVKEHKDEPFFLYLPFTAPHFPVEPHPEWKGRSNYGDYGDVVEQLDFRIGELLATLRQLDIEKHTIIVFTSDNGPNPGEPASPLPFRGEKWSALEGGTRVPCIVSWPGVIPSGQVSDALISAMDLLPSLSHACGIDWQAKSQGKPKIDGLVEDGANPPMLFHLDNDPGETLDMSARFPDEMKTLRTRAEGAMAKIKADGILPISTP